MRKVELDTRTLGLIRRHNLIPPGETIVIGVSGGADSVCLLHVLARWRRELGINLWVAHLNHQLRGAESEEDAKYVANLARQLGIPMTIDRQDAAGYRSERNCSIEEAGRELRYDFLTRVADDVGAKRVAIGHTRDDQVETILMHILRGTGTSGLRGLDPCSPIPSRSCQILVIRPLLDITRDETMRYCQQYMLEPRSDPSNLSLSFFRNRLRLELLPLLRQHSPSVDRALLRLAEIAKDDGAFIEQQASELWGKVARQEDNAICLDKKQFATLPIALQRQLIRSAIAKILGDTRDIEAIHIEAVRGLLSKQVGKRISLPHGLVSHGEYSEILITSTAKQSQLASRSHPFPPLHAQFPLKVPGETRLSGWRVIASIAQERRNSGDFIAEFDLHKTGTELFVRQREPGDRFQPLGMNITKKLQDFMVDVKIPRSWREHIPIVCSHQQIIWVLGWRIDDRVKVTEASKEILRLESIKSP